MMMKKKKRWTIYINELAMFHDVTGSHTYVDDTWVVTHRGDSLALRVYVFMDQAAFRCYCEISY